MIAGLSFSLPQNITSEKLSSILTDDYELIESILLPDDFDKIKNELIRLSAIEGLHLIITNGGTGLGPRDVTPEATNSVVDKTVPGISELIRYRGSKYTLRAYLSRCICGLREKTLNYVINYLTKKKVTK